MALLHVLVCSQYNPLMLMTVGFFGSFSICDQNSYDQNSPNQRFLLGLFFGATILGDTFVHHSPVNIHTCVHRKNKDAVLLVFSVLQNARFNSLN